MPTQNDRPEKILLSKAEAAALTGLNPKTLDAEILDGRLCVTRIRRRTMIHADDLASWLDRCRTPEGASDAAA